MDLNKVSNEEKLNLARKYYLGGFAFLPFLWAINSIWFFKEAFRKKPTYPEHAAIKSYVIRSMIGSAVWTVALTVWITLFQVYRVQWGATADYISFTLPLGRA